MSSTIVIHVLRPYANEEEYLASERFSIDSRSMLLIDQPPLPAETPIVFDVQLENGQKPIRAEAKVIGHVEATSERPGGLRVRFKRFGAATKSFIDRATARPLGPTGTPELEGPISIRSAPSLVPPSGGDAQTALGSTRTPTRPEPTPQPRESSGIHRRPVVPVAAPMNREELLERLRVRARAVTRQNDASPGEQTG